MPGIVNHPYDEREVVDPSDEKLGRVEDAYVDAASGEPVFLLISGGLFGARKHLVPVTGAELIGDDKVRVAYDAETVKAAPHVSLDEQLEPAEELALFDHYGVRHPGDRVVLVAAELHAP
ncbi:MAG: PRC-barrel domain-containing protein [Gaiellales bacterium]